ncbi:unnamed protein product [Cylindrotheca closterium]|uniref:SET domain-containing protein n=1 Tax=Cylindrotheca closterium TaxID=2856 RepID=A0AAD2CEC9_9STRA|nr:unnamed protein product [Cylindrotheca closterium]
MASNATLWPSSASNHLMTIMMMLFMIMLMNHCPIVSAEEAGVCTSPDDKSCEATEAVDAALALATKVVESLKATKDAIVSDKLEVRRVDPSDWTSDFYLFATENIEEDELLLQIPPEAYLLVDSDDYEDGMCDLKNAFLEQIHKADGKGSSASTALFADYIAYLKLTLDQILPRMPSLWSAKGKALLDGMLQDPSIDDDNTLPPHGATEFFNLECLDATDPDDILAMATALGRGWDVAITPVYDFIKHDNREEKINVENTSLRSSGKTGFTVKASDPIAKGEHLYHSFDRCIDCGDAPEVWGTPEIFRDKGFLEDYPQRFHFGGFGIMPIISLDIDQEGTNEDGQPILSAEWIFEQFPIYGSYYGGTRFMKEHLERLEGYLTDVLVPAEGSLPDDELEAILDYYDALIRALTLGVQMSEQEYWEPTIDYSQHHESLNASEDLFVVPEEHEVVDTIDDFRRTLYQAESLVYDSDHYTDISSFNSQYQLIDHYFDPETRDVCFNLDTIFQMCRSYWPYYHEVQVHKTAKYVKEDIKRVLFVGAGDNGLLNEIVKYPSLELVVGLELDQHVARLAFKHFGAQTHYHNEKVQWWYGDASKTLYMLPREYFGSFDMVLVDLSDTIFALTVSDELDVVGALSLLVKPGGVFAMNELFFKKVSDVFEYALYYQVYNIPKLGDQGFVIASNDVDLLNRDLTHHKVNDVLVEDTLLKTDHQFSFVHDYRRNPSSTFDKLCKDPDTIPEKDNLQDASPGIFMVLEVEELNSKPLKKISKVKSAIEKALEKEGMHVVSTTAGKKTDTQFVTILKEGYIVARVDAENKYCGFDILLWSSFESFEAVKLALIQAVGGSRDKTSSFRIVTGGMYGVSTWKEDSKSHGPQIDKFCAKDTEPVRAAASPNSLLNVILNESLDLVDKDAKFAVAVLCGTKDEACESVEILKGKKELTSVIPFYACSDSSLSDDEAEECANTAAKEKLDAEFGDDEEKIKFFVVDPSATIAMDTVIDLLDEEDKLEDDIYGLATVDSQLDMWKRSVVDRIRTTITRLDPVFRAHVLFNTTESSLEMAFASSGDELFIDNLKKAVSSIEKKSGLTAEIRNIFGGLWKSEPTYIIDDDAGLKFFKPEDFDLKPSLEQYKTQKPVGAQSIIQYTNAIRQRPTLVVGEDLKKGFDKFALTEHVEGNPFVEAYENIGDGAVHIAIWDSAMVLVIWDGRVQVDVNMFCADLTVTAAMQADLEKALPDLEIKLRDFHPRGYGQVVNFSEDLVDMEEPHWA